MRSLLIPALLVLAGCGPDTPSSSGPVPRAPSHPASVAETPAPSSPTPAPPGPRQHETQPLGPSATPPPSATPTEIATLPIEVMITQKQKIAREEERKAIQSYEAETGRLPKSLEEMWKHYQTPMPKAPSGMRFKYDPQTGDIDLVKE